jgi:hypothetical protein
MGPGFIHSMNHFPSFNPNEPALHQLSATKLNSVSQGQKSNQIQPGIGYRVTQTPGGTTVSVIKRRHRAAESAALEFPFEIYDTGVAFVSRAGTFNGVHDELTQAATTDGTWRLYASIVINVTTGEITDSDVAWYSSAQTNTATNYYHLIGTGVVADTGATRTVTNFNYGPIFFLLRGDVEGDWTVDFF